MKLKDFFKGLFRVKEVNINSMVNLSDSVVLPTRDLFKGDAEALNSIDSYKQEFKRVLADKHLLISADLTNGLNEKIRMYSDLITNIFTEQDNINDTSFKNNANFYKIVKLNVYKQEIIKLNVECTHRAIALMEIFNERKMFMSKYRKDALLFAISNLTNALVVFEAQRNAIQLEQESFLKKCGLKDMDVNHAIKVQNEICHTGYFYDKVKMLNRILLLFDKQLNTEDYQEILLTEIELEIHVYKFKEQAEALKKQIDEYYNVLKDKNSFAKFCETADIHNLEKKVLLYFYYGNHLIDEEYMYKLYELKLKYLTHNEILDNESPKFLDVEKKYYEQVMFMTIERISKGNVIIDKLFGNNSKIAIKYILEYLKFNDKFDINWILYQKKCKFLFSFDYEGKFIEILDNELIQKDYVDSIDFNSQIFEWDKTISKASVYNMIWIGGARKTTSYDLNKEYKLYSFIQEAADFYKLPEGIRIIHKYLQATLDYPILKNLYKKIKGKSLILPNSLEFFVGDILPKHSMKEIILNDNIKVLGVNALACAQTTSLIIPSSLENIINDEKNYMVIPESLDSTYGYSFHMGDGHVIKYNHTESDDELFNISSPLLQDLETLVFKDYQNSKLLADPMSLRILLVNTLSIQQKFSNPMLTTSLKTLIFKDANDEIVFSVDISNLSYEIEKKDFDNVISCDELDLYIKKIKIAILESREQSLRNRTL